MRSSRVVLLTALLLCLVVAAATPVVRHQPHSVRISHQQVDTHPDLVIDSPHPHFTWQHTTDHSLNARGAPQTHYQLRIQTAHQLLRKDASELAFDSGVVKSDVSRDVRYDGPALLSDTIYRWSLRYRLSTGVQSDWSNGTFRTAFLAPNSEFSGAWIGHTAINMNELRKEFITPTAGTTRATVFISGIGYYELYMNGVQVDPSRRLDPGWTLYEEDVLYVSYDVTSLLNGTSGAAAAVGVRLGDGWYSQQQNQPGFGNEHATYGPPRLLFQLNMQSSDGTVTTVVSDDTWMGREGTVTSNSPFMGETYSALKERSGWTQPNFIDPLSAWLPAQVLPSPLTNPNSTQYGLRLQTMDPVRAGDAALHIATSGGSSNFTIGADLLKGGVLHPIGVSGPVVGVFVYDMGQTFSGTCAITFVNMPPRILVSVQHAEVMRAPQEQGPFTMNLGDAGFLRGATNTDTYVTRGGAKEVFEPKFTVQSDATSDTQCTRCCFAEQQ